MTTQILSSVLIVYSDNEPYVDVSFECSGLIFNRHICWTQVLKNEYYRPSELHYVTESNDVWRAETNFDAYPILFNDIINDYIHFVDGRAITFWQGTDEEYVTWSDNFYDRCSVLKTKLGPSYKFTPDELIRDLTSFNTLIASSDAFYEQLITWIESISAILMSNNYFLILSKSNGQ